MQVKNTQEGTTISSVIETLSHRELREAGWSGGRACIPHVWIGLVAITDIFPIQMGGLSWNQVYMLLVK